MRQRLHIARGLLNDPEVVFMDEPTIGLDPLASRELREIVPQLAREGKTVLLTTHYMLEADLLCERVALINKGKLVADGTPADIKRQFSGIRVIDVTLRVARRGLVEEIQALDAVQRVDVSMDGALQRLTIQVLPESDSRRQLTERIGLSNVETLVERDPNLEEAYLSILR